MSQPVLARFGAYLLLDKIAEGGMAEVFRARPASTSANGRILVIKRILPQMIDDPQFLRMFRAEIQVTMGFNHPNTVQIHDFGEVGGIPYIAMEYLEGQSTHHLVRRLKEQGRPMPVPGAVGIAYLAARALNYVHNFKNPATGEHLNIIHRDISPQNIVLKYDGTVKIIDFGIAKANLENNEKTMAGFIKGKAAYFSPEQATGELLDNRSDIFSLGIVLWELLTGKRLFFRQDKNTLSMLEAIKNCNHVVTAPSLHNPAVSRALDALVLKALEGDRDKRIQTMQEFRLGLEACLAEFGERAISPKIREMMVSVYAQEIEEGRRELQMLNRMAQGQLTEEENSKATEMPRAETQIMPQFPKSSKVVPYSRGARTRSTDFTQEPGNWFGRVLVISTIIFAVGLWFKTSPQAGSILAELMGRAKTNPTTSRFASTDAPDPGPKTSGDRAPANDARTKSRARQNR